METQLETELVAMEVNRNQNHLYNSCCHARFPCPDLPDDNKSRCHSDSAVCNHEHLLPSNQTGNKTSQMYDAVVNSSSHSGCHGSNQCCCASGKVIAQGSMPRSDSKSQQREGQGQISVCIGANKEHLKQSCHLERYVWPPSGGGGWESKPRDSSTDAAQSHSSRSNHSRSSPSRSNTVPHNPATRCHAVITSSTSSDSLTRGSSSASLSSSPLLSANQKPSLLSANQKSSCSSSSSIPRNMTSRPPPQLMTSLVYAVMLFLSVISHNAPVAEAQDPEWITAPSDTRVLEQGTQRLYCRIRHRGNRAIAWIQYHSNGDVRNLFIDDARWAAPDR